jgi:hypothetical protein
VSDLVEFLLARIAEDEAVARVVDLSPDTRGIYQRQGPDGLWDTYTPDAAEFYVMRVLTAGEDGYPKPKQDIPATQFFRYHDPARVLREVEAKRRIVAEHPVHEMDGFACCCETCGGEDEGDYPCPTLRLLALPYADHEAYREEWRP